MRMGSQVSDYTCELCLHFTRQTRPADSPVLASLPLPCELRIFFPPISNAREFISLPHSYVITFNHLFPATLPVFLWCRSSLILICHVYLQVFFCWHLLLLIQQIQVLSTSWNKVDSCDLGSGLGLPCASVS